MKEVVTGEEGEGVGRRGKGERDTIQTSGVY